MTANEIMENNRQWVEETFFKLDEKLSLEAVRNREKLPYLSVDGVYDDRFPEIVHGWTNGFWGGLMWMMYAATGKEDYSLTAKNSEILLDKTLDDCARLDHDTGFLWHILSGASYRLTGNFASRNREMMAAMFLASRYQADAQYIGCWNGDHQKEFSIIDTMMNLPLLFEASRISEDKRFYRMAVKHADMTLRDHIRPDGSVVHIAVHDLNTGALKGTLAGQGYAEGSSWSRGQSWAIYGFLLAYQNTQKKEYLEAAIRVANYYISCVEKTNYLPLLDFRQPATPVLYDSTSGAIAACGLIELAKEAGNPRYLEKAICILKAMDKKWCDYSISTDGILKMGSRCYTEEIHQKIIYGDFFFVEAILKLKGAPFCPW